MGYPMGNFLLGSVEKQQKAAVGLVPGQSAYLLVDCIDEEVLKESGCVGSVAVNKLLCSQEVGPKEDIN